MTNKNAEFIADVTEFSEVKPQFIERAECFVDENDLINVPLIPYVYCKLDTYYKSDNSDLMLAIYFNDIVTARKMLEEGADPNFINKNGFSALTNAVEKSLAMVQLILSFNVKVDIIKKELYDVDPLIVAMSSANPIEVKLEIVSELLNHGAKTDNYKILEQYGGVKELMDGARMEMEISGENINIDNAE